MNELFDVHAARMNAGLSQRALAEAAGVSLTVVQRLENGATATPSNAKKVADYFGIQVTDLMPLRENVA